MSEDIDIEMEEFSEDTGFDIPEMLDVQEYKDSVEVAGDGDVVRGFKAHPGWKLLESFLSSEIDSITKSLIIEQDMKKIRKMQSMISALRLLPAIVDKVLFDADKARQMIEKYQSDEPEVSSANSN